MVNPASIPSVTLNNGLKMPQLGLGTWQSPKGEVYQAVKDAITAGYRHIDCALCYENEAEVGQAINEMIASGLVKRSDLFITSKLYMTYFKRDRVIQGLKLSLSNLKLDYLDLYLIHWPMAFAQLDGTLWPVGKDGNLEVADVDYTEAWQGMEDCVKAGLAKSIGISNFNSVQVKRVLEVATIKPVMNQIECHPYLTQEKLIPFCLERDILITAYSPLGNPGSVVRDATEEVKRQIIDHPVVQKLAKKYGKNAGQILIKWQLQRGNVVIPKSVKKERIVSNLDVFDFELTKEEVGELLALNRNERTCEIRIGNCEKHKDYPFKDDVEFY